MKTRVLVIVLLVLLVAVFVLWRGRSGRSEEVPTPTPTPSVSVTPSVSTTPTTTPTPTPTIASSVKTFIVTGASFSFSPTTLRVKKGDTVKIIFQNSGGLHDWVIDEFNAHTTRINSGETDEVTFVANRSGSFEYYCSVGNHRAMGMKGTLIVE